VTETEEHEWPAHRFDAHHTHLRAVAYRMLGCISEAEDTLQEARLRLIRYRHQPHREPGGWLTTVVGLVCLDMLRSRRSRLDGPFGAHSPELISSRPDGIDPEHEALTFWKFVRSARTRPALVNGAAGIVSWTPD
jgi:RNA polymerase sigma-70 factor, ECF subfamily